jgi:hypothetical protein
MDPGESGQLVMRAAELVERQLQVARGSGIDKYVKTSDL